MKKLYIILSMLSLLFLSGCEKDNVILKDIRIEQHELFYESEMTFINFSITNTSKTEKYIKQIRIEYTKNNEEKEMYLIFDDVLKANESRDLYASIEEDITMVNNIKYSAMKE